MSRFRLPLTLVVAALAGLARKPHSHDGATQAFRQRAVRISRDGSKVAGSRGMRCNCSGRYRSGAPPSPSCSVMR